MRFLLTKESGEYLCNILRAFLIKQLFHSRLIVKYLTVILRGHAGYELIYITNEAVGRVGYY